MSSESPLAVEIITPERTLPTIRGVRAILPGAEGELGILHRHAPLVCILVPGVVTITDPDHRQRRIAILGGAAQVLDDHIRVFTEQAADALNLREDILADALDELAQKPAETTPAAQQQRQAKEQWLRIQLKAVQGKAQH